MNTTQLIKKINLGLQEIVGKTIVHTAPHHDDILLGYFPYVVRNIAHNKNHVLYVTSGANGVSDHYIAENFSMSKQQIASLDSTTKKELKSAIREQESEKKWLLSTSDCVKIKHLRAEFYDVIDDADVQLAMDRDIARVVDYLHDVQPDVITLLIDPINIGPVTHYRSQQVLIAAIMQWNNPDLLILGYRNIWSSFSVEQASMIIPITQADMDRMESIFMQCFTTQNKISIISFASDAQDALPVMLNFAEQAAEIQQAQWQEIKHICKASGDAALLDQYAHISGAILLQQLFVKELDAFR